MSNTAMPDSLFRYYPANLQTLENIKRQCLYFGGVGNFNDPFECHILPPIAKDDDATIEELHARYAGKPDIPEEYRRQIKSMPREAFAAMIKDSAVDTVLKARANFIRNRGVTCFSERNENLLMWSHYASGGAGLCLEFDASQEIFRKAIKVRYRTTPPEVDALQIMRESMEERASWIETMYCTKPDDWKYEQEWRIIHAEQRPFTYTKETLKAVYFGPRCKQHLIETVCLILQGQNRDVRFFRGSMSHTRYAVEFEPFTYTANADIPQGVGNQGGSGPAGA